MSYAIEASYGWPGGLRYAIYRNISEHTAAKSYQTWPTREEAEAAARRASAGDLKGITLHEAPAVRARQPA